MRPTPLDDVRVWDCDDTQVANSVVGMLRIEADLVVATPQPRRGDLLHLQSASARRWCGRREAVVTLEPVDLPRCFGPVPDPFELVDEKRTRKRPRIWRQGGVKHRRLISATRRAATD